MPSGLKAMMYMAKNFAYAGADMDGGYLIISGYFSDNNAKYFLYELSFQNATQGIASISNEATTTEYYTIQGVRVANPQTPGVYVVRNGNKTHKTIIR